MPGAIKPVKSSTDALVTQAVKFMSKAFLQSDKMMTINKIYNGK
jgi:hypothetical protein